MASKAGNGFFHLFEWTKNSRKKLFANGNASVGEEIIMGKVNGYEDSLASQLHLIDEDEKSGVSSIRDSDGHSCASSMTDEEGIQIRAPGVVARLMGLDSMPTSGISEPHSTPLHDSRALRDTLSHQSSHVILRSALNSRRTVELRSNKMPSSPIERFQVEALPPRLAKPTSVSHRKLLSPVKDSSFISTKIIEPAVHKRSQGKIQSSKSSSSPLKDHDARKIISTPQKVSKPLETSRGPGYSVASKSLQALGRRRNIFENAKSLNHTDETTQVSTKEKGKSVSLAIQAKLNVQRREGLSTNTINNIIMEEYEACHIERKMKVHVIDRTNDQKKSTSGTDSSNVCRQNKQNYLLSKNKLTKEPSVSNQSGKKIFSRNDTPRKDKVINNLSGKCKGSYTVKKGSETVGTGKDRFSLNNKKICREGAIRERSYSKRIDSVDKFPVDKQIKHIQHNVVIGDHSRWADDGISYGAGVVSFTFTSPLSKPEVQTSSHEGEKIDSNNGYSFHHRGIASASEDKRLSSSKLNTKEGDNLGFLVELKLRELTNRIQSPYKPVNGGGISVLLSDSISSFDVPGFPSPDNERESLLQPLDNEVCSSNSNCSVTNSQVPCRHKLQEANRMDCYCSIEDSRGTDHQDQSPLSILEKSFSNESCYSSESFENADGSRTDSSYYSSSLSEDIVDLDCLNKTLLVEPEVQLSASSSHIQATDLDLPTEIIRIDHTNTCCWDELEYLKEILNSLEFISNDPIPKTLGLSCEILDPFLFEKLEQKQSLAGCEVEEKHRRMRRKIVFDAVNECLDAKYSHYFRAGFRMWAKGIMLIGKNLAQELYNEISGRNGIEDLVVDELVDKDMSTYSGRWINFEIEAFKAGAEIEMWLFDSLIDELFA
ncbi:hypothetical protein Cni_G25227 [Canna indica]|uniref:DUF4378 domain-containing protein n=1 Tax=Canna indica TaxID=4628 RepID=A0AAQ3QQA9_9LILI|nr:hypothetical protein Cni_G25227 [Canna indica]